MNGKTKNLKKTFKRRDGNILYSIKGEILNLGTKVVRSKKVYNRKRRNTYENIFNNIEYI